MVAPEETCTSVCQSQRANVTPEVARTQDSTGLRNRPLSESSAVETDLKNWLCTLFQNKFQDFEVQKVRNCASVCLSIEECEFLERENKKLHARNTSRAGSYNREGHRFHCNIPNALSSRGLVKRLKWGIQDNLYSVSFVVISQGEAQLTGNTCKASQDRMLLYDPLAVHTDAALATYRYVRCCQARVISALREALRSSCTFGAFVSGVEQAHAKIRWTRNTG